MPILHLTLFEGRTKEQKAELVNALTDTLCATLNSPRANVRIMIEDMPKHNYFVGGVSVEQMEESGAWSQKTTG